MKSTADRYREAGMPAPKGEVYIPNSRAVRARSEELLRETARRTGAPIEVPPTTPPTGALLAETWSIAGEPGPLPELPATAYGPDSVPLDTPDANNTEEQS
ncbi:hypothetical protein [Cellulomonas endometrii]|uniref:hypothetical protein n=1 Tax=Cellulomonas endometrii TaxID=3036301 RepID=UPI0024AD6BCB|nr:hypothetical protein [Cellulomonas endometrii]